MKACWCPMIRCACRRRWTDYAPTALWRKYRGCCLTCIYYRLLFILDCCKRSVQVYENVCDWRTDITCLCFASHNAICQEMSSVPSQDTTNVAVVLKAAAQKLWPACVWRSSRAAHHSIVQTIAPPSLLLQYRSGVHYWNYCSSTLRGLKRQSCEACELFLPSRFQ